MAIRCCWTPSWRLRSTSRPSFVGCSHQPHPRVLEVGQRGLPPRLEVGVLSGEQGDRPRRGQELRIVVELRVMHDRNASPSVTLDRRHVASSRCLGLGSHAAEVRAFVQEDQSKLRMAERPAQHLLQLLARRVRERLLDQTLQRARGEQLGRDQREEEAVPDSSAGRHEEPDDECVEIGVLRAEDVEQLKGHLAQQEQEGDWQADRERPPLRRGAPQEAVTQQRCDGECEAEDGVTEHGEDVLRERRVRRHREFVLRAQQPATGDRSAGADLRLEELDGDGECKHRHDAARHDDLRGPVQAPRRERQDQHVRREAEHLLPEQPRREQPAVGRRLEDVENPDEPQAISISPNGLCGRRRSQ
jgi:hypothetical protein